MNPLGWVVFQGLAAAMLGLGWLEVLRYERSQAVECDE
jgi:hypothetical protein